MQTGSSLMSWLHSRASNFHFCFLTVQPSLQQVPLKLVHLLINQVRATFHSFLLERALRKHLHHELPHLQVKDLQQTVFWFPSGKFKSWVFCWRFAQTPLYKGGKTSSKTWLLRRLQKMPWILDIFRRFEKNALIEEETRHSLITPTAKRHVREAVLSWVAP